jgi:hypothetical protein
LIFGSEFMHNGRIAKVLYAQLSYAFGRYDPKRSNVLRRRSRQGQQAAPLAASQRNGPRFKVGLKKIG